MKILLIAECSNLHATLCKGLKAIGHDVTVMSNGNGWRNYPRDISIIRKSDSHLSGIIYLLKLISLLPKMRGYDIVQITNPLFLDLKAKLIFPFYKYLRRNNKRIILGAFGTDWYWVHTCMEKKPLRYSDQNIGNTIRNDKAALIDQKEWIGTPKETLNKYIANTCNGIAACLYEYYTCYNLYFSGKTAFLPLPIIMPRINAKQIEVIPSVIKFFIGIDFLRNQYKGTDIMLNALENIKLKYTEKVEIKKAISVSFSMYQSMMDECDIILDQLYSYTPSMNSLLAMSKGIVCVGGGEPESYSIIHEDKLRPIVNVLPNYDSVYSELEKLVLHPERIPILKRQSVEYVRKHHEYIKVAKQYEEFYNKIII